MSPDGAPPSESFARSFLRLQQKFHSRAEQLQQQRQQQEAAEARSRWATPLYWPDVDASTASGSGATSSADTEDDLNIDGVISALLERNGPPSALSCPSAAGDAPEAAGEGEVKDLSAFAGVEPLTTEEIQQQLRLQLLAARHLQQGTPPPPALLQAIASSLPDSVREKMATRPAVMLQLSKQLKSHSREHVLEQLEERKRLLE